MYDFGLLSSGSERFALYNELSHMTPYYLYGKDTSNFDVGNEADFHIKNIKLMALYFDRIFNTYRECS